MPQSNQTYSDSCLSCQDVARILQVQPVTVRRLVQRQLLKKIPGIRHLRISDRELQRFIGAQQAPRS